jgi:cell wall-associated NlpC family hydrolase
VYSAVAATIGALFAPVPAFADPPTAPQAPFAPAVPDVGSRPMALGTLTMPGQQSASPPTPAPLTGASTSPVLQKIEKGRAEIATLGDQLIKLGQDRDLARDQLATAQQRSAVTEDLLREAQTAAADAAAAAMRDAAAMPPGAFGTGLTGLGDLARIQRGEDTQGAAARQIELAQVAAQLALDEQELTGKRLQELQTQYDKLNATIVAKQAAQQRLELANADELAAAEATQNAADSRLGAEYLAGAEAGRGADQRALTALNFALAQRGDPYVWSEEGPNQYDCSGLMFAAYRSVGFPLTRVSRDQYWQTRNKVVDRYSLLPGDLLFFSYSSSWRGIHHVAMYAGNGMMVEAPRTGLNVRLTPVRWSRLFQATRIFGSVEGVTQGPILGAPDPDPTGGGTTTAPTTGATSRPPSTPPTSPSSQPGSTPPTSRPPTTPPTSPSTSTTPSTSPSTSPSSSSSPPTSSNPTTTAPATNPAPTEPDDDPTTTAPANDNSSSSGGASQTSSSSASTSESSKSSSSSSSSKSSTTSSGSASASSSN